MNKKSVVLMGSLMVLLLLSACSAPVVSAQTAPRS